ncbi:hypothetical protein Aph01nite_48910 [Acrocarpospora phusangensis]|uniref:Uncharacterized protein n=1 Tax=Acrocarpospora phusangensis TaxID=1070424 RepID=A0A919ULU1_9ACTN|nr:hypothetical protein [Acrocarpospora phusangensis]GIH26581.1 hypothetical protein Aph01nite_48910 [Acrocarpospora phusangensis]
MALRQDGRGSIVDPAATEAVAAWSRRVADASDALGAARREAIRLNGLLNALDVLVWRHDREAARAARDAARAAAEQAREAFDAADTAARRYEAVEVVDAETALDQATLALSRALAELLREASVSASLTATVDGLALRDRYRTATATTPPTWDHTTIPFPARPEDVIDPELALPVVDGPDGEYARLLTVLGGLDEQVDAVADLLVAESLHQLVQGNPVRAGGSLAVTGQGQVPDEFDVVTTPRPGYDVTHRVIALTDAAGPPAWTAPRPGPAARLDPATARWAADLLPDPADVGVRVRFAHADGTQDAVDLRLSSLGLDPLGWIRVAADPAELAFRIAWTAAAAARSLIGTQPSASPGTAGTTGIAGAVTGPVGDGTPSLVHRSDGVVGAAWDVTGPVGDGAPSLVRRLDGVVGAAWDAAGPVGDGAPSLVHRSDGVVGAAWDAIEPVSDGATLADLVAAARAAGRLLGSARALDATDLAHPAASDMPPPATAAVEAVAARVRDVETWIDNLTDALDAAADTADPEQLTTLLLEAATAGVAEAVPPLDPGSATIPQDAALLASLARSAAARLRPRRTGTPFAVDPGDPELSLTRARRRAEELAGSRVPMPLDVPGPRWAEAVRDLGPVGERLAGSEPAAVRDWLFRHARVRPPVEAVLAAFDVAEVLGAGAVLRPRVTQLPATDPDAWAGGVPRPAAGTVSLVVLAAYEGEVPESVSGLVLDTWTQAVPALEHDTGVAFHYDQPDAGPPQAVLVAVHPDPSSGTWDLDTLLEVVTSTLELAKDRATPAENARLRGVEVLDG